MTCKQILSDLPKVPYWKQSPEPAEPCSGFLSLAPLPPCLAKTLLACSLHLLTREPSLGCKLRAFLGLLSKELPSINLCLFASVRSQPKIQLKEKDVRYKLRKGLEESESHVHREVQVRERLQEGLFRQRHW